MAGRPTDYKEHYNEQVYKLCLLGATDKDIAVFFEVTDTTINNWKIEYPLFFESIVNGKKLADMEVAHSLYKSTQDRHILEQQAFKTKNVFYDENGKRIEKEEVEIVEVLKAVPSDFRSQQFWLRNRSRANWKDKPEESDEDNENKPKDVNVTISIKDYSKPNEPTES